MSGMMTALSTPFCIFARRPSSRRILPGAIGRVCAASPCAKEVGRLPAAALVCNVHHFRAHDRPQSPLLVQPCVIAVL